MVLLKKEMVVHEEKVVPKKRGNYSPSLVTESAHRRRGGLAAELKPDYVKIKVVPKKDMVVPEKKFMPKEEKKLFPSLSS